MAIRGTNLIFFRGLEIFPKSFFFRKNSNPSPKSPKPASNNIIYKFLIHIDHRPSAVSSSFSTEKCTLQLNKSMEIGKRLDKITMGMTIR